MLIILDRSAVDTVWGLSLPQQVYNGVALRLYQASQNLRISEALGIPAVMFQGTTTFRGTTTGRATSIVPNMSAVSADLER